MPCHFDEVINILVLREGNSNQIVGGGHRHKLLEERILHYSQ